MRKTISKKELYNEIVRLNTDYQKNYGTQMWRMTQWDIDNPTHMLTEDEQSQRHIGAITALGRIMDFLRKYK